MLDHLGKLDGHMFCLGPSGLSWIVASWSPSLTVFSTFNFFGDVAVVSLWAPHLGIQYKIKSIKRTK